MLETRKTQVLKFLAVQSLCAPAAIISAVRSSHRKQSNVVCSALQWQTPEPGENLFSAVTGSMIGINCLFDVIKDFMI